MNVFAALGVNETLTKLLKTQGMKRREIRP